MGGGVTIYMYIYIYNIRVRVLYAPNLLREPFLEFCGPFAEPCRMFLLTHCLIS